MITVAEYARSAIGVFGLGKAGEATVAALLAGGAKVYVSDDSADKCREAEERYGRGIARPHEGELFVTPPETWPWENMRDLVLSPGIPLTHPKPHAVVELAKKHGCRIIGDIELLYRAQPRARYIAITGTNGKSTTTTLIGHILKSCGVKCEIGGNLGTPALALAPLEKDGVYVLELSSYQLDLVKSTRFNVAVWLNITPDHIDRHGDIEGYVKAKMHMFERQESVDVKSVSDYEKAVAALRDVAIVAVDDAYSCKVSKQLHREGRRVVEVSHSPLANGVNTEAVGQNVALYDHGNYIADIAGISTLTGRHNWQNAAAAYAAARAIGLAPEAICKAMQSFAGLRHRLQLAATVNGVRFINDSKATNADATGNALAPYDHIYWIAGGKAKEGGIVSLAEYFPKIAHAFLIGAAEDDFARTLEGKVPYTRCGTLKVAVEKAAEMAFAEKKKDAVVLLSPACASFDQWKNFEERGDAFCAMAEAIAAGKGVRHAS